MTALPEFRVHLSSTIEGFAEERTAAIQIIRKYAVVKDSDGDGMGGTAHMYEEVKRRTGQVTWIDTRTF